jgi:hypothetical protein
MTATISQVGGDYMNSIKPDPILKLSIVSGNDIATIPFDPLTFSIRSAV